MRDPTGRTALFVQGFPPFGEVRRPGRGGRDHPGEVSRIEAQTFLNELFACYGSDRQEVAWFEPHQAGGFLDLLWPRVCLFEIKAPAQANLR